jgi:RNA polymerase sigma factor (sigma-70 family)
VSSTAIFSRCFCGVRAHVPRLAEDITAEVWLQVIGALDSFEGDEQEFRAWIFTIIRNRIIDQVRHDARRPMILFADTEGSTATGTPSVTLRRITKTTKQQNRRWP